MEGKQPVEGPDGGVPAGAVHAHGEQVAPSARDDGARKPARDASAQRVPAVFSAFFGLRAIPASERS